MTITHVPVVAITISLAATLPAISLAANNASSNMTNVVSIVNSCDVIAIGVDFSSIPGATALQTNAETADLRHQPGVYLNCTTPPPERLTVSGKGIETVLTLTAADTNSSNSIFSSLLTEAAALPNQARIINYLVTFTGVLSEAGADGAKGLYSRAFATGDSIKNTAITRVKNLNYYSQAAVATITF